MNKDECLQIISENDLIAKLSQLIVKCDKYSVSGDTFPGVVIAYVCDDEHLLSYHYAENLVSWNMGAMELALNCMGVEDIENTLKKAFCASSVQGSNNYDLWHIFTAQQYHFNFELIPHD